MGGWKQNTKVVPKYRFVSLTPKLGTIQYAPLWISANQLYISLLISLYSYLICTERKNHHAISMKDIQSFMWKCTNMTRDIDRSHVYNHQTTMAWVTRSVTTICVYHKDTSPEMNKTGYKRFWDSHLYLQNNCTQSSCSCLMIHRYFCGLWQFASWNVYQPFDPGTLHYKSGLLPCFIHLRTVLPSSIPWSCSLK